MRLVIALRACRDLAKAIAFIAADDPDAADRVAARLRSAAAKLVEFPALGAPYGGRDRRVFSVPRTPFRLVYRARKDRLTILRIWHGARGWPPGSS